ncbi:FtsK/SpoIIIE domain-containing protein [Microbacterium sp. NPDC055683]
MPRVTRTALRLAGRTLRTTGRATGAALVDGQGGAHAGRRWLGVLIVWAALLPASLLPGVVGTAISLLLAALAGFVLARRWARTVHPERVWRGDRVLIALPCALVTVPGVLLAGVVATAVIAHQFGFVPWVLVLVVAAGVFTALCGVARKAVGRATGRLMSVAEAASAAIGTPVDRLRVSRGRDAEGRSAVVIHDAHKALQSDLSKVDTAVARELGDVEVVRRGDALVVQVASASTIERRRLADSSGGLVVAIEELQPDGRRGLTLADGVGPTQAEAVAAWCDAALSASMIEWLPVQHRAIAAVLDDDERSLRARYAQLLGARPHEVGIDLTRDDEGIARVEILSAPTVSIDPARRMASWRQLVMSTPGGHEDWAIHENATTGQVTLTRHPRRVLPSLVPLNSTLPSELDPSLWADIPLGLTPEGIAAGQDLTLSPHSLVVGPTNSGKTVALVSDAARRLACGHDLIIIDVSRKRGVDYKLLEPFARGFARRVPEAVVALNRVNDEGERRSAVLGRLGMSKLEDVPLEVREREGMRPLTVVIDEVAALLGPVAIPKGLPKNDPLVVTATELATQKEILRALLAVIARELRFVGIHLVLALQRPDVTIFGATGGEMRDNLTHRVQLVPPGKPVSQTALAMLFPADMAADVYSEQQRFDDGKSRGLAVIAAEDGGVTAVRVAYAPQAQVAELLTSLGVARVAEGARWNFASEAPNRPTFGEIIPGTEADDAIEDVSLDLGEFDLNLDLGEDSSAEPDEWADVDLDPAPTEKPQAFIW